MIYELICRIIYSMTMEQTFVATGIMVLIIGISLGIFLEWLYSKGEEKKDKKE